MKKQVPVFWIFTIVLLASCNYILHPSKYYTYSNNKISKADQLEDFRAVRKELHFRQLGDRSFDYYRLPQKINAPSDSAVFVKYVKEIVFAEFKRFDVDSIDCEFLTFSDANSVAMGGREHMIAGGRIFIRKDGKLVKWRKFDAACLPSVRGDIVKIQTFYHQKF